MESVQASEKQAQSGYLYGLLGLLRILSIGGMQGGRQLMADPSGQWLAVSPERFSWLITDFFLPGLFIFALWPHPLFLAYAILTRLK